MCKGKNHWCKTQLMTALMLTKRQHHSSMLQEGTAYQEIGFLVHSGFTTYSDTQLLRHSPLG